jgi:catechol 2,3-dioxygenase-like lactoylglutathione lyase family enzyme
VFQVTVANAIPGRRLRAGRPGQIREAARNCGKEHAVQISRLDHLVLTVASIPVTVDFYTRVLGMTEVTFGSGRKALAFGASKINLHQAGQELEPKALRPTPGSADVCLIVDGAIAAVITELTAAGVAIEEGPVSRTGAAGPILSVYLRDPDQNLIELSSYVA